MYYVNYKFGPKVFLNLARIYMRCNSRNECNPILSDPAPFHPSLELWEGGGGGLESENVRSPYAICSLDSKMICTNTIPVVKGHRLVSMRPLVSCLFPKFYSNFAVFFDQCLHSRLCDLGNPTKAAGRNVEPYGECRRFEFRRIRFGWVLSSCSLDTLYAWRRLHVRSGRLFWDSKMG